MEIQLLTITESAKHNHHHHHDDIDLPNPHSNPGPEERFTRLLMMLEAQFGSDISPIESPRLPAEVTNTYLKKESETETATATPEIKQEDHQEKETETQDSDRLADLEAAELARLQALGIPVPGIEIKADKHVARVWLEDLEVECANAVMRDRVRVVVERAVETVASMWTEGPPSAGLANGSKTKMEEGMGMEVEAKA